MQRISRVFVVGVGLMSVLALGAVATIAAEDSGVGGLLEAVDAQDPLGLTGSGDEPAGDGPATAEAADAAVQPLTVMTYNVLHGQPCAGGSVPDEVLARMRLAVDGARSAPGAPHAARPPARGGPNGAEGLAGLAPDIIGMQEVSEILRTVAIEDDRTCEVVGAPPGLTTLRSYALQSDTLARLLNGAVEDSPYAVRFGRDNPRIVPLVPDVPLPPDNQSQSDFFAQGGNYHQGLGALTKFRIQFPTVHNLTVGEVPAETRGLMHATILVADDDGNETPIDFYNSHLTTTGGDSVQTQLMAAEIARVIAVTRRHPESPGLFLCDCNAREGSATYALFADRAGYVDTYRVANPGTDGPSDFTSGRRPLSDDCAQQTRSRIDFVWALPDDAGRIFEVLSSTVEMDYNVPHPDNPDGCLWPSDHNAVLTTFDAASLVTP